MSEVNVTLPPLVGGQAESWLALIELAESLGEHWLLVGGQMVFLHEIERRGAPDPMMSMSSWTYGLNR